MAATELRCAYQAWEEAEERIAVLEQALYGQHEIEDDQEEDPEESEEDPEEIPENPAEVAQLGGPAEPAQPEEPAVPAPNTPAPAAPVPGHQNQFARMPAHFRVYTRQERRRGFGGFLE